MDGIDFSRAVSEFYHLTRALQKLSDQEISDLFQTLDIRTRTHFAKSITNQHLVMKVITSIGSDMAIGLMKRMDTDVILSTLLGVREQKRMPLMSYISIDRKEFHRKFHGMFIDRFKNYQHYLSKSN